MELVTVEDLPTSADRAWSYIGDFGGLARWHPGVRACRIDGSGPGALRIVSLDGWSATERLTEFDPARFTLAYELVDCDRPLMIGVRGTMRLEPLGPASCRIVWTSLLPTNAPAALEPLLRAYYPERIGHLRAALSG
jgi:hypothetical protein